MMASDTADEAYRLHVLTKNAAYQLRRCSTILALAQQWPPFLPPLPLLPSPSALLQIAAQLVAVADDAKSIKSHIMLAACLQLLHI